MTIPQELLEKALEHNKKYGGGSRCISYGGLECLAPVIDIKNNVKYLESCSVEKRKGIMSSVQNYLNENFDSVKAKKASQEVAMNCAQDVGIWFANEVLEGRASVEVN